MEKELNKAYTFGKNKGVKAYYNEQLCTVELPEAVFEYILSLVPTEEKWIPVSERLPEDDYGCLVTVYDTDLRTQDEFENILPYTVGYDGETWNNFCGEPIPFEVVAWMKLPEPYNETKAQ